MRSLVSAAFAAAVIGTLVAAPAADAQMKLNMSANDPLTGLAPAEWEQLVSHMLNAASLVGDPGVLVISSVPTPLTVTCDKWEIVGRNVYKSVKGNPEEIKPFSITYIKTNEFDGYCKQGVVGHTPLGKTIMGKLNNGNGSFTDATVILFSGTLTPQ